MPSCIDTEPIILRKIFETSMNAAALKHQYISGQELFSAPRTLLIDG